MGPCVLILADRLGRSDWVVRLADARPTKLHFADAPFYSARQLMNRVAEAATTHAAVEDVLLLEARMALGEVLRAADELKECAGSEVSPLIIVSVDATGADRIVRGYIYDVAREDTFAVPLKRFSKRIAAPAGESSAGR